MKPQRLDANPRTGTAYPGGAICCQGKRHAPPRRFNLLLTILKRRRKHPLSTEPYFPDSVVSCRRGGSILGEAGRELGLVYLTSRRKLVKGESVSRARSVRGCSGPGACGASDKWGIYILDDQASRVERISRLISACDGIPHVIHNGHNPSADRHGNHVFAAVGFPAMAASHELRLSAIRSLKAFGFTVFAYGDGLDNWPLKRRCLALLAGATQLLDSATHTFEADMVKFLNSAWTAELKRRSEEQGIKETMLSLGIVGESTAILSVFRTALRISVLSDLPVLLTGETGTGKECLAQAIHRSDPHRRTGPFVALNCAALSSSLAEAELFGHRRGTFTGAERDRKGLIRAANHGSLFLDEVGELAEPLQAKLLRVVQEKRVLSVGSEDEVPVDIRVIAATNRDLTDMVRQRRFRGDLLYRLQVATIHVPPLRERTADLRPLIEFLLEKHRSLSSGARLSASADFVEALAQAELPGNVRELEDLICQALLKKSTSAPLSLPLSLSDLPWEFWKRLSEKPEELSLAMTNEESANRDADEWARLLDLNGYSLKRTLRFCEKALVAAAVKRAGSQSQTAQLLGITVRSIYNKLHRHQIDLR